MLVNFGALIVPVDENNKTAKNYMNLALLEDFNAFIEDKKQEIIDSLTIILRDLAVSVVSQ